MIPVYQPTLGEKEKQNVMECLDSTWISSKGRFVRAFESEFAAYIGTKYGTAVNNGTVALHLALLALGIGKGDEVIVPSFTFSSTVNAFSDLCGFCQYHSLYRSHTCICGFASQYMAGRSGRYRAENYAADTGDTVGSFIWLSL